MKKTLLLIVLGVLSLTMWAQSDLRTAILQHDGDVSVFKGATAFADAYAIAVDGDVITLSDGTFTSTPIAKSITIYGAGFESDEETNTAITTLSGDLIVGVADATLSGFHIEGVKVNGRLRAATNSSNSTTAQLQNCIFKKCYVTGDFTFSSNIENVSIEQCLLGTYINGTNAVVATNLMISNCYVTRNVQLFNTQSTVLLDHCIIGWNYNGYGNKPECLYSAFTWTNCIQLGGGNWSSPSSTGYNCTIINCAGVGNGGTGSTTSNCYNVSGGEIFVNGGAYTETNTFELQQPDVWVGTDGTPIGPSGGIGWNKVPCMPVVKSLQLNVDGKTLNVNYEADPR